MPKFVAEDAVDEVKDAQCHYTYHQLILEVVEISIVLEEALDFDGVFVVWFLLFYDSGVVAGGIVIREIFSEQELH